MNFTQCLCAAGQSMRQLCLNVRIELCLPAVFQLPMCDILLFYVCTHNRPSDRTDSVWSCIALILTALFSFSFTFVIVCTPYISAFVLLSLSCLIHNIEEAWNANIGWSGIYPFVYVYKLTRTLELINRPTETIETNICMKKRIKWIGKYTAHWNQSDNARIFHFVRAHSSLIIIASRFTTQTNISWHSVVQRPNVSVR